MERSVMTLVIVKSEFKGNTICKDYTCFFPLNTGNQLSAP